MLYNAHNPETKGTANPVALYALTRFSAVAGPIATLDQRDCETSPAYRIMHNLSEEPCPCFYWPSITFRNNLSMHMHLSRNMYSAASCNTFYLHNHAVALSSNYVKAADCVCCGKLIRSTTVLVKRHPEALHTCQSPHSSSLNVSCSL